jgi:hypothetical protein
MLPSTLKYLYSVEQARMHFPTKKPCTNDTVCNASRSTAHSIICACLFCGKMHSEWFNGIEILQGRWQHGETVGYCCSIAHSIICTWLFCVKMHSEWFNGIEILQGRWQYGEKVGYCYPSGLRKTLCKWDIYVPLVTKGLTHN